MLAVLIFPILSFLSKQNHLKKRKSHEIDRILSTGYLLIGKKQVQAKILLNFTK
ncbi:hypothetical protein ACEQPO_16170 [Bacillus sp. SL00103]